LIKVAYKNGFQSVFCAPHQNFKILAIPNVLLAHGKSYEHGFVEKYNGHKICAKPHFDRFFGHCQNFKVLAIPNVLAHGKSYEYGFVKKMQRS
ncbi:hypothetical protein GW17_00052688, partial [Ensete ventricosum]